MTPVAGSFRLASVAHWALNYVPRGRDWYGPLWCVLCTRTPAKLANLLQSVPDALRNGALLRPT